MSYSISQSVLQSLDTVPVNKMYKYANETEVCFKWNASLI